MVNAKRRERERSPCSLNSKSTKTFGKASPTPRALRSETPFPGSAPNPHGSERTPLRTPANSQTLRFAGAKWLTRRFGTDPARDSETFSSWKWQLANVERRRPATSWPSKPRRRPSSSLVNVERSLVEPPLRASDRVRLANCVSLRAGGETRHDYSKPVKRERHGFLVSVTR